MPFTLSDAEYADMVHVYGFFNGNAVAAVAEYHRRLPNRRTPDQRVFTRVFNTLHGSCTLPSADVFI
jgi:hypothetical protein